MSVIEKKSASVQARALLLAIVVVPLVGVGFFSYSFFSAHGMLQKVTIADGGNPNRSLEVRSDTSSMDLVPPIVSPQDTSVVAQQNIQNEVFTTPPSQVQSPIAPATQNAPEFPSAQGIVGAIPGISIGDPEPTSLVYGNVSLVNMEGVLFPLRFPTGEEATLTIVRSSSGVVSTFVGLQNIIEQLGVSVGSITPTTMNQRPAFYYNRLDKAQNVGIVIEHENGEVYAFDYPVGYHQAFKSFFQML